MKVTRIADASYACLCILFPYTMVVIMLIIYAELIRMPKTFNMLRFAPNKPKIMYASFL
jgi:hypothetical protein